MFSLQKLNLNTYDKPEGYTPMWEIPSLNIEDIKLTDIPDLKVKKYKYYMYDVSNESNIGEITNIPTIAYHLRHRLTKYIKQPEKNIYLIQGTKAVLAIPKYNEIFPVFLPVIRDEYAKLLAIYNAFIKNDDYNEISLDFYIPKTFQIEIWIDPNYISEKSLSIFKQGVMNKYSDILNNAVYNSIFEYKFVDMRKKFSKNIVLPENEDIFKELLYG